jgi:hypothetical protein
MAGSICLMAAAELLSQEGFVEHREMGMLRTAR